MVLMSLSVKLYWREFIRNSELAARQHSILYAKMDHAPSIEKPPSFGIRLFYFGPGPAVWVLRSNGNAH